MGQHRRRPRRRRLLAPVLLLALGALAAAGLLSGNRPPATRAASATAPPSAGASALPSAGASALPSAGGAGAADEAVPSSAPSSSAPSSSAPPESAGVGALFSGTVEAGHHFCTASVLHSVTGNLLLTAAHCLDDPAGITFVPGYHDGAAPYGSWQVTAVHTTSGWSSDGDEDEDFAILETAPSAGRTVESVVGGNELGTGEPVGTAVRLYGYPSDEETVRLCTNTTGRESAHQRVIDCPDYPGGTSGGPWISTVTGRVIGAIGGHQEGGDDPDTSYSVLFDDGITALYAEAVAAAS
ncbi:trypsin-like serine peptidase [Kitasatospora sp. NPDC004240]